MGGTIQLAIFGMVAAQVKMNANGAHTFLEVLSSSSSTFCGSMFTLCL